MKSVIEDFIREKNVALVGASRDAGKWGSALLRLLKKKGYRLYPVNPNADRIEGEQCYVGVKELPEEVTSVIMTVRPEITEKVVKECSGGGIKRVWMHAGAGGKGSASKAAKEYCRQNGIDVVYGLCPMMFYPPAGIHKLHFWFRKLLGKLPEELKKQE